MATIIATPSPLGCYNSNGLSEYQTSGAGASAGGSTVTLNIAQGSGNVTVYVSPKYKTLKIEANGRIETLDPGYDWVKVSVDGKEVLYRESTQDNDECDYETVSASATVSLPICNACGTMVYVEGAPNDNICNDGVSWTVTLTPQEN